MSDGALNAALDGPARVDDSTDGGTSGGTASGDALDQVATAADFGRELTALRERAKLSVRKAARLAGIPSATFGGWSAGTHLPGDHVAIEALTQFLRACGVTSQAETDRWLQALARAKRPPGRKSSGDAPYRGLARFEEGDAHLFFGREEVAERLAALMTDDADFHDLPLVLVGPSGVGKSSVLRAGLLPRLTGPAVVFEPTAEPLAALKTAQQHLSDTWPLSPKRPALIVDQFETLFTACQDEARRHAFVSELCELAESRAAHVVIALRADFYDHVIRYAELANALQYRQVVLGPMTAGDVSRAITEPARLASLNVEAALVRLLLEDLTPRKDPATARRTPRVTRTGSLTLTSSAEGAYEPGALPLLSHAMLATWEKSHGSTLTVADYLASGRIRDAVARTAEAAYETLTQPERQLAGRLFLHLVHVSDDAPPTRAVVSLSELRDWSAGSGADADHVLSVFVSERMITVDADSAQITHDALITAWPRLRSWIDAGQAGLVTRRRITDAARAWEDAGQEDTWLWRGGQLEVAADWAGDPANRASLTKVAGEFVTAALHSERARQLSDRRRTRTLQGLVAVLTALVVVVGLTAAYAFAKRQDAVTAQADATSRQLAVEAQELRGQDPAVAAQLSVAAYHVARTPQAAAALLESSGVPYGARVVDTDGGVAQWTAISPDHAVMAVAAADGTLKLWNVTSPGHPVLVDNLVTANSDQPLYVAAFSPDGKILAAAGAGEVVKLWNVSDPAHPVPLPELTGPASTIYSVAFSPDGHEIAAGSNDTHAWLWHISDPDAPAGGTGMPLAGATAAVNSVAFGLDGKVLATGSADNEVRLWNLATSGKPALAATLAGPADVVSGVAFSPRGELAATSHDHKVWLWKVSYGTVTTKVKGAKGKPARLVSVTGVQAAPGGTLTQATGWTNTVSFSPDGSMLAAGTSDASVLVWTVATHALAATIPAPQPVTSVTWDGADRIADSDADGTATIWTLPAPVIQAGNQSAIVAYSPDGKTIAVGGATSVELWNAASHALIASYSLPSASGGINGLAYSPDGNLLAAAYANGTVAILSGQSLAPVSAPFTVTARGLAESVAFSPDGKTLATGSDDGTMRLFAMANPAHPVLLAKVRDSNNYVYTVAFAPNGETLAAAGTDDDTRLWNVTNPAAPRLESTLGGLQSYAIGLAFTPDSKTLAISSADKTVHLWNVANPAAAVQIGAPLTGLSGYVWAAAISPDGRTLAVGVTTGTVWLWNIANPASPVLMGTLTGPAGHVYSVAFNPAGTQLAASSNDGTVFTWDVSPAAAASGVCSDLGQPLTAAEWATYAPGLPYKAPCS